MTQSCCKTPARLPTRSRRKHECFSYVATRRVACHVARSPSAHSFSPPRGVMKNACVCLVMAAAILWSATGPASAAATDIVLYASDVSALRGNWSTTSNGSSPGGQMIASADAGWSSTGTPLAAPADYFEATFSAPAGTAYHIWLRLRASGNSKWNDSVYVQFDDAVDSNGSALYRIGTTAALTVNLENCNACGV